MHMKDKINTYVNDIKKLFSKDITEQVTKYRIPLIGGVVVILLACISIFVTYAFYQVEAVTPIVGGSTGDIADIELRVMVEDRIDGVENIDNENYGTAIEGEYVLYPYIPEAGYEYNSAKSYCTNGSVINYDPNTFEADITAYGHDVCYMYFDSTANLDITLRVHAENVDATTGEGTGNYTILETTTMPSIGYELNQEKTTCTSNATVSYIAADNLFSVEATGKAECDVYMDALNVDIALKIFLQAKSGSPTYYEADTIPSNYYYDLNSEKSSCTGTSTLSLDNQRVVVAATSRTSCVAYLDVASGPILESMNVTNNNGQFTIDLINSNIGTTPTMYYFSSDNGDTFVNSTSPSYTFNLEDGKIYQFAAYAIDSSGKTSAILKTNNFIFNGTFSYSNKVQELSIPKTGYYLLEVWGAQGGSYNESVVPGGKGGYSKGYVYLNENDVLYIHTGGKGSYGTTKSDTAVGGGGTNGGGNAGYRGGAGGGGTDIRINEDSLYARVIVAGGGGGSFYQSSSVKAAGGAGGGTAGLDGAHNNSTYSYYKGLGGTQSSGGAGGTADGNSEYEGQSGTFGVGGNTGKHYSSGTAYANGAGGGGWYGGGGSGHYNGQSSVRFTGGGGGSGYVYTESTASYYPSGCLLDASYYLQQASTYAGNTSFAAPNGDTETGHSGNGYAKVTYIGESLE